MNPSPEAFLPSALQFIGSLLPKTVVLPFEQHWNIQQYPQTSVQAKVYVILNAVLDNYRINVCINLWYQGAFYFILLFIYLFTYFTYIPSFLPLFTATAEPGDEEAVTRAKYFIRDEFLVSTVDSWFLVSTVDSWP